MKQLLIVEDDDSVVNDLIEFFGSEEFEFRVATDRDTAIERLGEKGLDFIICDLRIPASAGQLATSENHGFAVYEKWREICPGVPLVLLSGYATLQNTREKTGLSPLAGVLPSEYGPRPMFSVREKIEISECVNDVKSWFQGIESLIGSVGIDSTEELSKTEMLALAAFGRDRQAASVEVRQTTQRGMSGSATLLATYRDQNDSFCVRAFVKVGPRPKILEELRRFQGSVPGVLRSGSYPPLIAEYSYGLGDSAALFYDLVGEANQLSLFQLIVQSEGDSNGVVALLESSTEPWHSAAFVENLACEHYGAVRSAMRVWKRADLARSRARRR